MKIFTIEDLFDKDVLKENDNLMESASRFFGTKVGELFRQNEQTEWDKTRMSGSAFLYDLFLKRQEIEKEIDKKALKFLEEHPEIETPEHYFDLFQHFALIYRRLKMDIGHTDKKRFFTTYSHEDPDFDPYLINCIEKYINYRAIEISYVLDFAEAPNLSKLKEKVGKKVDIEANIDKIDIDRLRRVRDMLDDEDEEVSDKAMQEAEKILAEIFGNELSPNEIAGLIKQIIEEDEPEGSEEDLSCPDEITEILGLSKGNITSMSDGHIEQELKSSDGNVIGKVISISGDSVLGKELEKVIRKHSDELEMENNKVN